MKLHAYLRSLEGCNAVFSSDFLFKAIERGIAFSPKVILARAKRSKRLHSKVVCRLDMEKIT